MSEIDLNTMIENLDIGEHFLDLCTKIRRFVTKIDVKNPNYTLNDYEMILNIFDNYLELCFIINRAWVEDHPNILHKYHETKKTLSSKLLEIESEYEKYFNETGEVV